MAREGPGEGEKKNDGDAVAAITKKKSRGLFSRAFGGIFRIQWRGDVGKRLEMISKEEAVLRNRMKNRSLNRSRYRRRAILFTMLLEMIAVVSALMARGQLIDMDWKTKALRALPMFLWPGLSIVAYSAYRKLIDMSDEKDQKTLKSLRSERQQILDELKEKTKFYEIQQMIQKYDSDPAAKAAAAAVLASKLGADSGLKVYLGDDRDTTVLKSNDSEPMHSSGLRKRKEQPHGRSSSEGSTRMHHASKGQFPLHEINEHDQLGVNNFDPRRSPPAQDSGWAPGWISQIAAFLVGEDPTQSYAMICSNCLRHNGLVSKEDFPHTRYYCPYCSVLNQSKNTSSSSGSASSERGAATESNTGNSPKDASSISDSAAAAAAAESEILETAEEEQDAPGDSAAQ